MVKKVPIPYEPVEGKTYSLFGNASRTDPYYQRISELTDLILGKWNEPGLVLKCIQSFGRRNLFPGIITPDKKCKGILPFIIRLLNESLADYTVNTDTHLHDLNLFNRLWDKKLSTSREQYHLYMLEVELINRINQKLFLSAGRRIALLPHCLKDFSVRCKSEKDSFDYQCKNCSKNCYENYITLLLRENGIKAYIWMGSDFKNEAVSAVRAHETLAILGIACLPELVSGMRKCQKYNLPVIGLPLDANRCKRWMGSFHPNSVNLGQLETLVSE